MYGGDKDMKSTEARLLTRLLISGRKRSSRIVLRVRELAACTLDVVTRCFRVDYIKSEFLAYKTERSEYSFNRCTCHDQAMVGKLSGSAADRLGLYTSSTIHASNTVYMHNCNGYCIY
eukprot:GHUV01034675.1.p1 GENE.GHUV01034675.1~~GHUV01034675.1.p1  ORF type:complete len:118 (-),score=9.31 GHUV01034675.1:236-589(-)